MDRADQPTVKVLFSVGVLGEQASVLVDRHPGAESTHPLGSTVREMPSMGVILPVTALLLRLLRPPVQVEHWTDDTRYMETTSC